MYPRHLTQILAFCLCLSSSQYSVADLIPNADFEKTQSGQLASWKNGLLRTNNEITESSTQPGPKGVSISLAKIKNGNALKLYSASGGEDYGLAVSDPFPMLPGYDYEMAIEYKAEGLRAQSVDKNKYASLILDLYMSNDGQFVESKRIQTSTNSKSWITVTRLSNFKYLFQAPEGINQGVARISLNNKYPQAEATAWVKKLTVQPLDPSLPNSGFETLSETGAPLSWQSYGSAQTAVDPHVAHSGTHSVSVTNAPDGPFTGWSTLIPVRGDREYSFSGYAKTGTINANGFLPGAALEIQFLDQYSQPLDAPIRSEAVESNQDWTLIKTPMTRAPAGAVLARLTAGMLYTNGTAWFDDLSLTTNEVAAEEQVIIELQNPGPDTKVTYAENILPNGDVELGENGQPTHWTYVGSSAEDWTEEALAELYDNGRPKFSVGRGKGEWSRDVVYSGEGALLNVSIDPPLSPKNSWYGRNPVDGYWLSDPVACNPGDAYLAGAWIRPGKILARAWTGPLEIRFYDNNGHQVFSKTPTRAAISSLPPGQWSYYATLPYIAPENAHSLRVRFGQEFAADKGGWGRTFADNIAVWKISPEIAKTADSKEYINNTSKFRDWFISAHEATKAPFLPSPEKSTPYENIWGKLLNSVPGNVYRDPTQDIDATFALQNLQGEKRSINMRVRTYDAWGNESPAIVKENIQLPGGSSEDVHITIPATQSYGAFFVHAELLDGDAIIGEVDGRFAVIPEFQKAETPVPILGVTPLVPITGNGSDFENQLGKLLQIGGFGIGWARLYYSPAEEDIEERVAHLMPEIDWYRNLGMECVVQLIPKVQKPLSPEAYSMAGRMIAEKLKGKVLAYGNWGIEQANSNPFYRGDWGDTEYDTIMSRQYDAIKAVDPDQIVLTGNIATDLEAKTLTRLYKAPGDGKFDGTIINAYSGMLKVMQNALKTFDKHGDYDKMVWSEEQATQRAPYEGEARRYGEIDGAKTLVRNWISLIANLHPRIRSVSMWGFVLGAEGEIMMVTPTLQPRPQFVAHTILADFLRGGGPSANHSTDDLSLYEWNYGDRTALVAWANAGERAITLTAENTQVTVTDIMGNAQLLDTHNGELTLKLTDSPVFITNGGQMGVSKRLSSILQRNDKNAGQPNLRLSLHNNTDEVFEGVVNWSGPLLDNSPEKIRIEPNNTISIERRVDPDQPSGASVDFQASITTPEGGYYAQSASFNFAQAVFTKTAPSMDGTWKDWSMAPEIPFGVNDEEIVFYPKRLPDVTYRGIEDIRGNLRMLWDDEYLYLGIEALDDIHVAQPERNQSGFMGDSIEIGFQPEANRLADAPYWEFEAFLPGNTPEQPIINRRQPVPSAGDIAWQVHISPTGERGHLAYQIAIPWTDIGITDAAVGKLFSMAIVLNDADRDDRLSGYRKRIRWFSGIDIDKDPSGFGQVQLVLDAASERTQS